MLELIKEELKAYRLKSISTIYYIPNFITHDQEKTLLNKIREAPKTKWVNLKNRRLQMWGGQPQPKGMIIEPIPKWLDSLCESVFSKQLHHNHKPNHVLINEYKPGQGIMPHTDGPLYHPVICTVSLGSHTVLEITKNESEICHKLLLEPRSLIVITDEAYTGCLHGISEVEEDDIDSNFLNSDLLGDNELKSAIYKNQSTTLQRNTRVSITIRNVLKSFKINLKF